VALDQATVQRAIDKGDKGAVAVMKCLKSLSTQLSSCQLGITLTTLLTGFLMEPAISSLLRAPLAMLALPEAVIQTAGVVIAMTVATLLSMLIGELVPKNASIALPMAVGKAVARPQLLFTAVFKPAITSLTAFPTRCFICSAWKPRKNSPAPGRRLSWPPWCAGPPKWARWMPVPQTSCPGP
jgi:CBS domain containing-hemolysin-like protein